MPAGRPTKYNDEILEKAQAYLDGEYVFDGSVIPSSVGLALYLDVNRSTVQDWGKDPEKAPFSTILDRIQAKQHQLLISKGLTGDFNAAIAKLALGKHGYSEKSENTHQGPNGEPITLNFNGVSNG